MKACQLCGVTCWGPISGLVNLEGHAPQTFLVGKELSQFRRCDGCGSYAAMAWIEEVTATHNPSHGVVETALHPSLGPPLGPFDQAMSQISRMLTASVTKQETRAERLVRAVLSSGAPERINASSLVLMVHQIEMELDRWEATEARSHEAPTASGEAGPIVVAQGDEATGVWLILRFADRQAFETWAQAGLHDTDCPTHLERTLAKQFADWAEERR